MVEILAYVSPLWVEALYQSDFFVSAPGFPLFFAGDRVADVAERFESYKFGGVVCARESLCALRLVFCYSAFKVIGYADV